MSEYRLNPCDIALYFNWGDFKHSEQKFILDDVWTLRHKLLAFHNDKLLFKNQVDQAMIYLREQDCDNEYEEIMYLLKKIGSNYSPENIWDDYSPLESFFKLIMLRLTYSDNTVFVRKKMRTVLLDLGYMRRSQQLVERMTRCCDALGISIFVRGGIESDFRNVDIDEWITFRLKS